MRQVTSSALMLRVWQGDRGALGQLYDRHAAAVRSLALDILGSEAEAEIVLEEVFVEAWREAPRSDPGRDVRARLVGAALEHARNRRCRPGPLPPRVATLES